MGHCEPASGIAGIMKSVLALERGVIPPIQNLKQVNPNRKLATPGIARALCIDVKQSIFGQEVLRSCKRVRRGQMAPFAELA